MIETRRYLWQLYPTEQQVEAMRGQNRMSAELWNALLQRFEDIQRRTVQRQSWVDGQGKRHSGVSIHNPSWVTQRKARGEIVTVGPATNRERGPSVVGLPKHYTFYDMQNEVTWLANSLEEWRAASINVGYRVAALLDHALKAFFRRMGELSDPAVYEARARKFTERKGRRPTRYELAGYPRFKRVADHHSTPHRMRSGCKLAQRPARQEPGGFSTGSAAPGVPAASRPPGPAGTGSELGQIVSAPTPRIDRNWQLTIKGVPGIIHARGALPGEVTEWLDADVMFRDGKWWISACVKIERAEEKRLHRPDGDRENALFSTRSRVEIKFDLLDDMARVNGVAETPAEIVEVALLQDARDDMQAVHDLAFPRRPGGTGREVRNVDVRLGDDREVVDEKAARAESRAAMSRLSARIARKRRNALHVWTAGIIRRASDLTIVAPEIRENTTTPRGGESQWGANVAIAATLNRHTLAQAPALAIQMLVYKAMEAGIRCDVVTDDAPKIAIASELVQAGRKLRAVKRQIKRDEPARREPRAHALGRPGGTGRARARRDAAAELGPGGEEHSTTGPNG